MNPREMTLADFTVKAIWECDGLSLVAFPFFRCIEVLKYGDRKSRSDDFHFFDNLRVQFTNESPQREVAFANSCCNFRQRVSMDSQTQWKVRANPAGHDHPGCRCDARAKPSQKFRGEQRQVDRGKEIHRRRRCFHRGQDAAKRSAFGYFVGKVAFADDSNGRTNLRKKLDHVVEKSVVVPRQDGLVASHSRAFPTGEHETTEGATGGRIG